MANVVSTWLGYGILYVWANTNLNVVMELFSDIIDIENIRLCVEITFHNSTETVNLMKILKKKEIEIPKWEKILQNSI